MNHGRALLIGFGSIGTAHYCTAGALYSDIIVVDSNKSKLDHVNELKAQFGFQSSFYSDLNQVPKNLEFDLCIIATWGPDHFRTFKNILSKGCKSFIIEKPLTSKLSDLYQLRDLANDHEIRIMTNLQTNYSNFSARILELTNEFQIGDPLGFHVNGGAKCVATNGIHYLALANKVFNEYPSSVVASLQSEPINPRGVDLSFFDGVASWTYPSNRNFSVHFHNDSRLSTTLRVIFKYGYMEVINNTFRLYGIDPEVIKGFTKPAHTSSATILLREGDAFESPGEQTPMQKLYDDFLSTNDPSSTLDVGFQATEGIIAALISSTMGVKVNLSDMRRDYPDYLETDWKIS